MRVITGSAKGHHLKAPRGDRTRPMLEKVRGSLFAVLEGYLGAFSGRVLDLYAGSGSLGIEALSRGAEWADFVEVNAGACRVIQENLARTRLAERGHVYQTRVQSFLRGMHGEKKYDIIFLDPPYEDPAIGETLDAVACSSLVHEGTLVAVHHAPRVFLAESPGPLRQLERRRLGDSALSIYGMPAWWQESIQNPESKIKEDLWSSPSTPAVSIR